MSASSIHLDQIYIRSFWRAILSFLTFRKVFRAKVVKLNRPFVFDKEGKTAIIEIPEYAIFGTFDAESGSLLVETDSPKWKRKILSYSIRAYRTVSKKDKS